MQSTAGYLRVCPSCHGVHLVADPHTCPPWVDLVRGAADYVVAHPGMRPRDAFTAYVRAKRPDLQFPSALAAGLWINAGCSWSQYLAAARHRAAVNQASA